VEYKHVGYVAKELWSLCLTDVFITVPLSQNKKKHRPTEY